VQIPYGLTVCKFARNVRNIDIVQENKVTGIQSPVNEANGTRDSEADNPVKTEQPGVRGHHNVKAMQYRNSV